MRNRKHLRVYQTLNSASADGHRSDGLFVYFILSMIATPIFKRVLKRQHHIYTHDEVDDILDYLSVPVLKRGAIAKIARDTGIPDQIHSRLVFSEGCRQDLVPTRQRISSRPSAESRVNPPLHTLYEQSTSSRESAPLAHTSVYILIRRAN
jgi:hypothetical protein